MHVVGHQYVGMDGTAKLGSEFLQVMQVELEVFFGVKAHGTVVAALDDVPGNARDGEAGATGHDGLLVIKMLNVSRETWSVPYLTAQLCSKVGIGFGELKGRKKAEKGFGLCFAHGIKTS